MSKGSRFNRRSSLKRKKSRVKGHRIDPSVDHTDHIPSDFLIRHGTQDEHTEKSIDPCTTGDHDFKKRLWWVLEQRESTQSQVIGEARLSRNGTESNLPLRKVKEVNRRPVPTIGVGDYVLVVEERFNHSKRDSWYSSRLRIGTNWLTSSHSTS